MTRKNIDDIINLISVEYREFLSLNSSLKKEIYTLEEQLNNEKITVKRHKELKSDLESKLKELNKNENIAIGVSIAREILMDNLFKMEV